MNELWISYLQEYQHELLMAKEFLPQHVSYTSHISVTLHKHNCALITFKANTTAITKKFSLRFLFDRGHCILISLQSKFSLHYQILSLSPFTLFVFLSLSLSYSLFLALSLSFSLLFPLSLSYSLSLSSPPPPTVIRCTQPQLDSDVISACSGTVLGSVCHFSCPEGYLLQGHSSKSCQRNGFDGIWSNQLSFCLGIMITNMFFQIERGRSCIHPQISSMNELVGFFQ